jgi:YD repeat-containing protein
MGHFAAPIGRRCTLDLQPPQIVQFGDVNGDGTRELKVTGAWYENATPFSEVAVTYLVSQNADRSIAAANLLTQSDPLTQFRDREIADFNNDGRADFVVETNAAISLYYYNPDIVVPGVARDMFSSARLVSVAPGVESQHQRRKFLENVGTAISPSYRDQFVVNRLPPQMVDVNGDGLTDLAGSYPSTACPLTAGFTTGLAFEWYQNLGPAAGQQIRFDTARKRVFCLQPFALNSSGHLTHEIVTKTIDFDGNGLPDYFIGKPIASSLVLFPDTFLFAFNDVRFSEQDATTGVTAVTRGSLNIALAGQDLDESLAQWIDINGDGLVDLVYPNGTWQVQVNVGGRMSQAAPFDTGNNATLEKSTIAAGRIRYRDFALAQFADLDSDGKSELVVPYAFEAMGCYSRFRETPIINCPSPNRGTPGACNILVFCPASPQMDFAPDISSGLASYPLGFWSNGEPSIEPLNTFQMTDHDANPSIYKMRGLKFEEVRTGGVLTGVNLVAQVAPATPLLFSPGKRVINEDLHADGLDDMLSAFGCNERGLVGSPLSRNCIPIERAQIKASFLSTSFFNSYDEQINFSSGVESIQTLANFPPRVLLSRNAGSGERASGLPPKSPDMLGSASDAFGVVTGFTYFPLSSKAGRAGGGLPLYTVPARDSGQGYIDPNHFYFTSSMNVVASMQSRNGIGGFNETRYGYEEAMYNNKGRGFSGFRKIITEDVANELRSATVYHQKFPRISEMECSVTQTLVNNLADLKCDSTNAISLSTTTHTCDGSTTCAYPAAPITTPIKVFATASNSVVRDLNDRARKITTTDTSMAYDTYGNVTTQTTSTTDFGDFNKGVQRVIRAASATSTNTFAAFDESNWWLNKLERSNTTAAQSYSSGHAGGMLTTPTRSTTTLYGYDSNRQVDCEALSDQALVTTATCTAPGVTLERKTTRSFGDSYGNVTAESTTARDLINTRSSSTSYGSDGYFPIKITDAQGKSVNTVFNPGFGVPTSATDANGLTSTTTLDGLGRPIRQVAPVSGALKAAMPSITSYERCGVAGVDCSGGAKMRVVSSQFGGGQSAVYLDSLGRTIRTASKLKGAGYQTSNFSDTGASVAETRFYERGLVQWQYQPNFGIANPNAVTYFVYDTLGRPIVKKETFNRVNQSNVLNAGVQHRRTEYTHAGLTTSIRVCQRLDDSICPTSGANVDGSPILNMGRSFDSAGKLLSTQDANAKSTHYWFDGVGNPLQIIDVVNLFITATYNNFGHRTSVTDPDRGTWNFAYNGLGELIKQCDARVTNCSSNSGNYITRLNYDVLGRVTSRTWQEPDRSSPASVSYQETNGFENSSASAYGNLLRTTRTGTLASNQAVESWSRRFDYDGLNRVTQSTTTMQFGSAPSTELAMKTAFDSNYGRVKQTIYPRSALDGNSVSTYAAYDALGVLTREGFAQDYNAAEPLKSAAIRMLDAVDGRGLPVRQYLGARAGSAIEADWQESNQYDSSGWLLARCIALVGVACELNTEPTGASTNPLHEAFRYNVYGNLVKHTHGGVWLNAGPMTGTLQTSGAAGVQTYVYDALHRLSSHTRNGNGNSETVNYSYNDIGGRTRRSHPAPECVLPPIAFCVQSFA